MLDFSQFEYISFDCYGTLIDWESGILGYLRPLLRRKNRQVTDDEVLDLYAEFEPRNQQIYKPYREVLAGVVSNFAADFNFEASNEESIGLAESIRHWQPFSDIVPALWRLKNKYKLAVLSNIDDDLFALTAPKLGVELDLVVTAQQVQSYKPSLRNFETLLQRLPVGKDQLLHAAESSYHDVVPAHSLGIATAWVNRRQGRSSAATKLVAADPDIEIPTVGALADLLIGGPSRERDSHV
jgi:2-haloacid dehalogenase